MEFQDRKDAGRKLAQKLSVYTNDPNVLVLALPRGGVPVAFEVARALHAPLDLFLVRKLGVPGREELAMGAIASGGVRVLNEDVVEALKIPAETIETAAQSEEIELRRREQTYRDDRPPLSLKGRTAIVVDDGLATGSSMRAALAALRKQHPARIVVAVPVAAPSAYLEFKREADQFVCPSMPEPFQAVGRWYKDFSQTTDEEIAELLAQAAKEHSIRTR